MWYFFLIYTKYHSTPPNGAVFHSTKSWLPAKSDIRFLQPFILSVGPPDLRGRDRERETERLRLVGFSFWNANLTSSTGRPPPILSPFSTACANRRTPRSTRTRVAAEFPVRWNRFISWFIYSLSDFCCSFLLKCCCCLVRSTVRRLHRWGRQAGRSRLSLAMLHRCGSSMYVAMFAKSCPRPPPESPVCLLSCIGRLRY